MTEMEWIGTIAEDARKAANLFGYLPSVLIAQTCQENGYGMDESCKVLTDLHNVLGMKRELLNDTWTSDYWNGEYITKITPEWDGSKMYYINDDFRKYDRFYDCFADYCQFMRDAKYSKNGSYKYRDLLGTKDPYTLIEGVRSRGYCTDPNYSKAVMDIIKKHNLTQYDSKEGEKMGVSKPDIIDLISENKSEVPAHNANEHKYLAIHYLGVDGKDNPYLYGGGYGGHFYVSIAGLCYQSAKVTDKLWHVGASSGFSYVHPDARNANTIGIECGCFVRNGKWYFTEETQESCAHLAAWIMDTYNIPMENLLRHGDITTKHCPSPWIDNPGDGSNWTLEQFKERVQAYLNGEESSEPEKKEDEKSVYTKFSFGNVSFNKDGKFKGDDYVLQTILRGRGFVGKDGKPLALDGVAQTNTIFAANAYMDARAKSGVDLGGRDVWGAKCWADAFGRKPIE